MNKVKMFFIAAAMLLTTAGVFAGYAKFAAVPNLWAYDGNGHAFQLASGDINTTNLSTAGSTPASIVTSLGSTAYGLYYAVTTGGVTTYNPVYTVGF